MHLPDVLSGKRRWLMSFLLLNAFTQAGCMILIGWITKSLFHLLEKVTPDSSGQNDFYIMILGLVGLGGVFALLKRNERILSEKIGQSYIFAVRSRLFKHMTHLSRDMTQARSRGGIMLRMVGDLNSLRQWVSLGMTRLLVASVTVLISLITLAFMQWILAVSLSLIILIGCVTYYWLGYKIREKSKLARKYRTYLAANLYDKISNIQVVQVFGQEKREHYRVKKQGRRLINSMIERAAVIGTIRSASELMVVLSTASIFLVGFYSIQKGETDLGTLIAAMSIIALLASGLRDLGRVGEYWNNAVVSREKINNFFNIPAELFIDDDCIELGSNKTCGRTLQLVDCSSGKYLHHISATAKSGECIAIVGSSGAGKSSLFGIITRLIKFNKGKVLLDGVDIRELSLQQLRREISILSPDLGLLKGSIRYNLTYRNKRIDASELDKIIDLCNLREVIDCLDKGINTKLKDGGKNLSVGQRQRIALARAIVGEPRILLLDEVDANLDPSFIKTLDKVINQINCTVLLITHRLDTVRLADKIWYIDQGRIVEQGTTKQLLSSDSLTAKHFQIFKSSEKKHSGKTLATAA